MLDTLVMKSHNRDQGLQFQSTENKLILFSASIPFRAIRIKLNYHHLVAFISEIIESVTPNSLKKDFISDTFLKFGYADIIDKTHFKARETLLLLFSR